MLYYLLRITFLEIQYHTNKCETVIRIEQFEEIYKCTEFFGEFP